MYNAAEEGNPPEFDILPSYRQLQQEYDVEYEMCFVRAAAKHYTHEITTKEYFDHLVAHLREGAVRHTFDSPDSLETNHLLQADIICATIKSTMLDPEFIQLNDQGD